MSVVLLVVLSAELKVVWMVECLVDQMVGWMEYLMA